MKTIKLEYSPIAHYSALCPYREKKYDCVNWCFNLKLSDRPCCKIWQTLPTGTIRATVEFGDEKIYVRCLNTGAILSDELTRFADQHGIIEVENI